MSKGQYRLAANQRQVSVRGQGTGRLKANAGRPLMRKNASKASIMAAAAIEAAKLPRLFKRPSLDTVKEIAQVALFNMLGPDMPPWAASAEKELVEGLKTFLDGLADTKFMRVRAVRETLAQAAKRKLAEMEPLLPFQAASDEVVTCIAKAAAAHRRSSPNIANFSRALLAYCSACLGYSNKGVVATYLFLQLQRHMERLKQGRYVRMAKLYEKLEAWAEDEIAEIEDILIKASEGAGGGRKLRKWDSPRGYVAYELTIRYQRTRKCYLIVEESNGEPYIVGLKSPRDFRRNLRKRFNRNARNSYANVPPKLQRRSH